MVILGFGVIGLFVFCLYLMDQITILETTVSMAVNQLANLQEGMDQLSGAYNTHLEKLHNYKMEDEINDRLQ